MEPGGKPEEKKDEPVDPKAKGKKDAKDKVLPSDF